MTSPTAPLPVTFRILKGVGYVYLVLGYLIGGIITLSLISLIFAMLAGVLPVLPGQEIVMKNYSAPPTTYTWVSTWISFALCLLVIGFGLLYIFLGYGLIHLQSYRLCLAVAILSLLAFPIGTCLGALTLLLLPQGPVSEKFRANDEASSSTNA